jgi:hypothetical protein
VFILLEFQSPSRRIFIGSHSLPPSLVRRIGPSGGYDAHRRIEEIRRKKSSAAGDNDSFLAFSTRLRNLLLPEKFKPLGITKYNAKQDPVQWLRCYTLSIENAGGNNDTKCLYFPFCLDQAPLTWLESLNKNSIDEWD